MLQCSQSYMPMILSHKALPPNLIISQFTVYQAVNDAMHQVQQSLSLQYLTRKKTGP